MTLISPIVRAIVAVLFFGALWIPNARAADPAAAFHNLNQGQRNFAILQSAFADLGHDVGLNCKLWVQRVVSRASNFGTAVPPNDPHCDYRWVSGPNVTAVACDMWNGVSFFPGQIIQAQVWQTGHMNTFPHTMIVVNANAATITVIESNFARLNTVTMRTWSWADFKSNTIHYTLYSIN